MNPAAASAAVLIALPLSWLALLNPLYALATGIVVMVSQLWYWRQS